MATDDILPARNKKTLRFQDGNTVDIQKVIFEVNSDKIWRDTEVLSQRFAKTKSGLNDLWRFVKHKIRYEEDPDGVQYIKYPARLWADKKGDCKSFTLFIVSVLQNLGIKYTIRFTSYKKGSRIVTHVYPVAHLDGEDIILDAVWYYFNSEKKYAYKEDFKFKKNMATIYKLSDDVGGNKNRMRSSRKRGGQPRSLENTLRACVGSTAAIPDAVLQNDVTRMTEAQFYDFLGYRKVSGINAAFDTNLAFAAPTFNFDTASVHGFDTEGEVGKLFKKKKPAGQPVNPNGPKPPMAVQPVPASAPKAKKKNVVRKVLDKAGAALKKAWAKLTNFLFKGALQAAAPFFLFTFLKKNVSPAIAAKTKAQNKILNFICKVAKIDRAKIDAALRQGIFKKYGKQPEQMLNAAAKSTVAGTEGVGFVTAVMAALPAVIEIVKKIAAFFKKSTADLPKADEKSASDLDALAKATQATGESQPAGPSSEAGQVVVKPTKAQSPVVNPTPEQAEAEADKPVPNASSNSGSSSGGQSSGAAQNEANTEGGDDVSSSPMKSKKNRQNADDSDEGKGNGKKDNTMMYAGIAAAVVLVLVMNK